MSSHLCSTSCSGVRHLTMESAHLTSSLIVEFDWLRFDRAFICKGSESNPTRCSRWDYASIILAGSCWSDMEIGDRIIDRVRVASGALMAINWTRRGSFMRSRLAESYEETAKRLCGSGERRKGRLWIPGALRARTAR